ncbi:MAG: MFS transporter [Candidatus Nanoarchaeia archaeon]
MATPLRYAPLSSGFMVTSIIGFLVSIWLIMDWSQSWGFTFALFFAMMFIASMISMTKAEPIPEHMEELAIHRPKMIKGRKDTSPHFNGIHWYEPLLIAYFIIWLFFVFRLAAGKIGEVNQAFTAIFMLLTLIIMVFFIVDAISNDRLSRWEQLIFTVLLVFTAGLGIFIYYIYKRMKS